MTHTPTLHAMYPSRVPRALLHELRGIDIAETKATAFYPRHSLAATLSSFPESQYSIADQHCSPLFCKLPPELRNRVFYLSLLEHDDPSTPIPLDSYAYRPSHQFTRKHSGLSLLQTCKRVYLEAYLFPLKTTTHCNFRYRHTLACPPCGRFDSTRHTFEKMTLEQREAIEKIEFTAQQCDLQLPRWAGRAIGAGLGSNAEGRVRPRKVVIAVRYQDWYYLEANRPSELGEHSYDDAWRAEFRTFGNRLEEVVMELEMTEERKEELEQVVKGVMGWKIPVDGGKLLVTDGMDVKTEKWEGARFTVETHDKSEGEGEKENYVVVTVTWKALARA